LICKSHSNCQQHYRYHGGKRYVVVIHIIGLIGYVQKDEGGAKMSRGRAAYKSHVSEQPQIIMHGQKEIIKHFNSRLEMNVEGSQKWT
jgi:hypothetical protein